MNRPTTSKPCSFSSHAATEESTPPDMPTTTLPLLMERAPAPSAVEKMLQDVEGMAVTRAVVRDAALDERTAVPMRFRCHLVRCQPQGAHDAGVECARGIVTEQ